MALKRELIVIEKEPRNAATPLNALGAELTPTELFYVRNHFSAPEISPESWRLRVEGSVNRPLELSLAELQSLGQGSVTMVMECAGNAREELKPAPPGTPWNHGAVSVAQFAGVPLAALLDHVQLKDNAIEILFEGADSGEVEPQRSVKYRRSLPRDQAFHPDTLLAWQMNGEALSVDHGRPIRLVVPDWYGMASVKWLTRIEALTESYEGYFQQDRYVYKDDLEQATGRPVSRMKVRSLIIDPEGGSQLNLQPVKIKGVAWSGHGSIEKVEVSLDQGASWLQADYQPGASNYVPGHWTYDWSPERTGVHTIICRATDSAGNKQPPEHIWNALGYGNNGVQAVTFEIT